MILHYLGKSKHVNSALKSTKKTPKTIRDISNLKKENEILIVFVQKFLTEMAIKWPVKFSSHLTSVSAILGKTEQMQHKLKI